MNKQLILRNTLCTTLIVIACCIGHSLKAQNQTSLAGSKSPRFGVKGGANFSNLYVDDIHDERMKVGYHFGLFARIPAGKGFSIQPELLYTSKGSKITYDNFALGTGEYRFNLNYVEMPVAGIFHVTRSFHLDLGAYVGYMVAANVKDLKDDGSIENITDLNENNFNRFDVGLLGGLGIDAGNVTIGARYNYGLKEIGKSGSISGQLTNDSKNSVISLFLGVAL